MGIRISDWAKGALTVAALMGLLMIMSGCTALDDATGTTLAERCAGYRTSLATLDALRVDRELTEPEANRRIVYQSIIDTACVPLPPHKPSSG